MSTSVPAAESTARKPSPILPEEQFWQKYSPHNEAPLSGVSSTVIHILILGLILLVIWVQSYLKTDEENRSLPVEPIRFNQGGGGGSPDGSGSGAGDPGTVGDPLGRDDQGAIPEGDPNHKNRKPPPEHQPLDPSKAPKVREKFSNDDTVKRYIERSSEQFGALARVGDASREVLRKAVNPGGGGGKGQGGTGSDGGRDVGKDKGQGGGKGDGTGTLTQREKRVIRWALTFNTSSGQDYLNQLAGLGAMIAIPIDENKGRYELIRDLRNPRVSKEEDIGGLNRIYWIDDRSDSVNQLFTTLGRKIPERFVAFFPKEVEDRLLRLELAHAERKYRTRDEDRIHETKFDVILEGGKYDVRVREVYLVRK